MLPDPPIPKPTTEPDPESASIPDFSPTIDDVEIDLDAHYARSAFNWSRAQKISAQGLRDTHDRGVIITTKYTDRYDTPEGKYVIMFTELLRLKLKLRLKGDAALLLDWLCLNIYHENQVSNYTQAQIVQETGIARPSISRALKILEQEHEILLRGTGRSVIWLNPRYFFKGSAPRQKKAAEVWDQMMAVRPRTEETDRATISALRGLSSQNNCEDMTEALWKIADGTGPDYVTYGTQKRGRGRPRKADRV